MNPPDRVSNPTMIALVQPMN